MKRRKYIIGDFFNKVCLFLRESRYLANQIVASSNYLANSMSTDDVHHYFSNENLFIRLPFPCENLLDR
jgi:hypothetical protein